MVYLYRHEAAADMMRRDRESEVACVHMRNNVKMLCTRVQTILQRRRKQKRAVEISAPFNLKLEPATLPGVSEDEICILREKAAASRIGVFETMPPRSRSPSLYNHKISRPRYPEFATALPAHAVVDTRPVW